MIGFVHLQGAALPKTQSGEESHCIAREAGMENQIKIYGAVGSRSFVDVEPSPGLKK